VRIALDSWPLAARFRNQGTYVYATNLIAEFRKAAATLSGVEFSVVGAQMDSGLTDVLQPSPGFSVAPSAYADRERSWRFYGATREGKRIGADLMFSPSCNVLPLGKLPMVCTIHDVTPIVMPSNSSRIVFLQKFFLRAAARRSAKIITVSECSKRDLMEHCGVPEEKVAVVHNGYDTQFFNTAPADREKFKHLREPLGIGHAYIFHHGVIQPRKNLKRLIEAWRVLASRRRDLHLDLVLAGPWGWQHEQVLASGRESSGCQGNVVFPGRVSSEDLAQLVKGAALVVIPSLYEGFCLPMVEAMACGVPVLVSDNSCFREISAESLLYFDPLSIDDIAAKMELALFDSGLRSRLIDGGLRRASHFSWELCGRETLDVLLRAGGCKLSSEARA
jgi:glycosyltransferase involved in cell wall biosynthesis